MSTFVGHFVSSPRELEKGTEVTDEREMQIRQRKVNDNGGTAETRNVFVKHYAPNYTLVNTKCQS